MSEPVEQEVYVPPVSSAEAQNLELLFSPDIAPECPREPWMIRFLVAYARYGVLEDACAEARISRWTVANYRASNAWFGEAYSNAEKAPGRRVRRRMFDLAADGWDEPVFQGGARVGTVRKFDTGLIWNVMKTKERDEFGDKIAIDLAAVSQQLPSDAEMALYIPAMHDRLQKLLERAGCGVKAPVE